MATATKPTPAGKILDDGTLLIHGVIGDEFDGLDSAAVVEEIHGLGETDEIRVNINSPGGLVSDGISIYTELATHPADVVVEITGLAASMASAIAMAGDVIRIAENGLVMIHNPWNVAVGDSDDLRKAAEILDKFGDSLVGIYAKRTGLDEGEIRDMMAEETWMDAEEAQAKGFVDEIMEASDPEAFADLDVSELTHVPAALNRLIREGRQMAQARAKGDGDPQKTKQQDPPKGEPQNEPTGEATPAASGDVDVSSEVRKAIREQREEDRQRRRDIVALAEQVGLDESWAEDRFRTGDSIEDARAEALDALTARQENGGPSFIPGGVEVTADARDKFRDGATQWLIVKAGRTGLFKDQTFEPGEYRGMSLMDLAREALSLAGVSTRGMSKREIAGAALMRGGVRAQNAGLGTTSDFPVLLENVLHKMLLAAYDVVPDTWSNFCGIGSVSDFRPHPRLRPGSFSQLDDKLESGEFQQKHFPDAEKQTVQAATKGNIVGLSREAIVNDDVDGFSRLITMLGRAAALSVEIDVYAALALNSGLGPDMNDGDPLFHARTDADNITTGAALSSAAIDDDRVALAQIKDPSGNEFLDLRPSVLLVPIGLGSTARQINEAEFDPDSTSGSLQPNVTNGLFEVIVDTPRISGTRRYLFADPDVAPVLEVVYLDGQSSPMLETEEGFDYDGVRWRVVFDYGVDAIDFRGAITNAGA